MDEEYDEDDLYAANKSENTKEEILNKIIYLASVARGNYSEARYCCPIIIRLCEKLKEMNGD